MRNLISLGTGEKFLWLLLWQELDINMATAYEQQHGQFEEDVSITALSWGNYRSDSHEKTLMCDVPLYDAITINEYRNCLDL